MMAWKALRLPLSNGAHTHTMAIDFAWMARKADNVYVGWVCDNKTIGRAFQQAVFTMYVSVILNYKTRLNVKRGVWVTPGKLLCFAFVWNAIYSQTANL